RQHAGLAPLHVPHAVLLSLSLLFFLMLPRPPTSTLFPYTTLFRSCGSSPLVISGSPRNTVSLQRERPNGNSSATARIAKNKRSEDRKSTRLNSSHLEISYAVFWLKKKKTLLDPC